MENLNGVQTNDMDLTVYVWLREHAEETNSRKENVFLQVRFGRTQKAFLLLVDFDPHAVTKGGAGSDGVLRNPRVYEYELAGEPRRHPCNPRGICYHER